MLFLNTIQVNEANISLETEFTMKTFGKSSIE